MPSFAHVQHALFPRIAALSELGWSAAGAHDWNGFLQRLTAELARYRALGIGYADSAFAPAFDCDVQLARECCASRFPTRRASARSATPRTALRRLSKSTQYVQPLEFSAQDKVTLRAATFEPGGFDLAAPRTQVLDASTLLSRDGSELASCARTAGHARGRAAQPARGPRPVYKVDAATCAGCGAGRRWQASNTSP